jgi:ABC-2 type transport system permease protein
MNTPSNAMPESPARTAAPAASAATRPFYWSVRRELWENRSIWIAPLAVAALMLVGFLIASIGMPERRRGVLLLDLAQQRAAIGKPYDIAAIILIVAASIVGVFYCLDALHGERRDRSILFWKSLPVSDLTTVLSKAAIPLLVLPLLTFVVVLATQLVMMLMGNVILLVHGVSATTFAQLPLFQQAPILLYGLITLALWHAPVYGWLLMVSAWAQRAAFLWALSPLLVAVVERVTLGTSYVGSTIMSRLGGGFARAFVTGTQAAAPTLEHGGRAHQLPQSLAPVFDPIPDPVKFFTSPALWIGLAVAVAFLAVAVWLRRRREPM